MAKTWLTSDKTSFLASTYEVLEDLLPGYYTTAITRMGHQFTVIPVREDTIYDVSPDMVRLFKEVERFWAAKDRYKALGAAYKRGVLLEGPAGGGKSTIIRQAINRVIERGGYALKFTNYDDVPEEFIADVRTRQPEAPIVVVLEDIDAWLSDDEEELLELLDGSSDINNVLFIATTNNFDDLPDRLKDRPGRFDTVLRVEMPSPEIRVKFVSCLLNLPVEDEKVQAYADAAEIVDKSLAHIKEFVLMKEIYAGLDEGA